MMDLVHFSKERRAIAERILDQSGIMRLLARFGSPHIIGSYALDLMIAPDIDIVVACDDPHRSSIDALGAIAASGGFQRCKHVDFVRYPRPDRPFGYIIVCSKDIDGTRWEVETWFFDRRKAQEDVAYLEGLRSRIGPTHRPVILQLKHDRPDKHAYPSKDIYEAVIGGARSLAAVKKDF